MSYSVNPEWDLVLERTLDVSPDKIFAAWTNPDSIKHWFCPKPWKVSECEIDLRPGGKFRTVMEGPDGERMDNTGCYLEIIENEKLVFTDALGPDFRPKGSGFMTAILILTPIPGGTRYTAYALQLPQVWDWRAYYYILYRAGWRIRVLVCGMSLLRPMA